MNKRLFLATTAAVAIATSAFAQSSPSTSSSTPSATQQKDSTSTPSSSTSTPSNPSGSAQTTPSSNSAQSQSPTNQTAGSPPSNSGSGTNTTQAPSAGNSTNQAQTNQPPNPTTTPSNQAQTNSPSSTTQSANPPASGANQAQSPSGSGSTNTAQQPNNQQNTADRSSNTNVNASVNDQQRTRISASISHLNVQPLTNVNFSLSVGTVVPRDVRLQPLPAEVVEIVPQYRGYNFVLVKDEIVIVEPSTYKIVTILPYSGRSTAAAPARTEQRKVTFSDRDREVVRKHAKARPVEREKRVTTGSSVRTEIRTGERVPEGVEIEAFPEEVYRDAPTLREYRYINRDSRTYIVEPHERRVIEEID
ncbi:DUF1236 domain-containing protein [Bradyrhizobium sp. WYCCWR 12699]|uniref:DUF1236 domain-containing protein n=1 Tax=Bradyrhizobium sp. WYCCWR 12699 TaxID=3064203 RepID=UPI0028A482FF|nr:DUF1236 domain-containing protein [Bradyrhizobium sp. WYCCWR 12699]MDT4740284.1 DUF1236 domain-containing protein [Bradyrhizobium sp. WYCCWR 12699]